MLEASLAQLRFAASIVFGMRFSPRSLERLVASLLATRSEFGAIGSDQASFLGGPTLDEETRREMQLRRFRTQAARAAGETAYYRRLFERLTLDPARLSYEEIARLPLTAKEDLRADPDAFVCQAARPYVRALTTGTTGWPTSISFSAHELRVYSALTALSALFSGDLEPEDIVQISTSARGALGNVCLAGACAHLGAMVYLAGVIEPAHALALPGETGTIVATPFPPYRETTLVLRYDTGDVVRALAVPLACSLRHLPATSPLLGKLRLSVRHEHGWTFPRQLAEALEALEEVPLPARYGCRAGRGISGGGRKR